MMSLPLLVVSLGVLIVVLVGASGVGSQSRVVGLHIPYIERTERTWIRGHRAARPIIEATATPAAVLSMLTLFDGMQGTPMLGVGWVVLIAGSAIGCVAASQAAKSVLAGAPQGEAG